MAQVDRLGQRMAAILHYDAFIIWTGWTLEML